MSEDSELFLGELRLSRQLQTIRQVASVGIALALGLSLVLPGHVLAQTGVRSAVPTLVSMLVLLLTLLNITELLGGSGERGGAHTLVHESIGGLSGFLTGWSTIAGYILLTEILAQAAGGVLTRVIVPLSDLPNSVISIGLLVIVLIINLFHLLPRRETQSGVVLLSSAFLIILLITAFFTSTDRDPATLLQTPDSLMQPALWPLALYAAMEAILSSRRRVLQPTRKIPLATLITILLGGIFILILELLAHGFRASNCQAVF